MQAKNPVLIVAKYLSKYYYHAINNLEVYYEINFYRF